MAMQEEPATVLVTGATGFIASHLIKSLLDDGIYKVRGTVRDLEDAGKVQPVRDLQSPDSKYPLKLVQANLADKEGWTEAVRGCRYVYHVASPFPRSGNDHDLTPEQQKEMIIDPAVDGMNNVLQAVADVGDVKRVVVTSSMAAVSCGLMGIPGKAADYQYSENDWSDESVLSPYELSKKKAEEAAWYFVEKLENDKKFELAVVNPCYVQGPLLSASSGAGTQELCSSLLAGKISAIPDVNFLMVDVRDVVALHKVVMENPEGAGKRFLAVSECMSMKEIATVIKGEFQQHGYKISLMSLPKFGLWIFKIFDPMAKELYKMVGKKIAFNNERMRSLGVTPRPMKDTIIDTCYSLIEKGVVEKKRRYKGLYEPAAVVGGAEGQDVETSAAGSGEAVESSDSKTIETTEAAKPENKRDKLNDTAEIDNPDETDKYDETTKPAESAKPDETTKPAESAKPDETTKPAESAKPDETTKPAESAKPDETTKPAETAKSCETINEDTKLEDKTAKAAQPDETTEKIKSDETMEAAKSDETSEPAKPDETSETISKTDDKPAETKDDTSIL